MLGMSIRLKRGIAIAATAVLALGLGACEVDEDPGTDVVDPLEETVPAP
jgi:hypothetical protein